MQVCHRPQIECETDFRQLAGCNPIELFSACDVPRLGDPQGRRQPREALSLSQTLDGTALMIHGDMGGLGIVKQAVEPLHVARRADIGTEIDDA